MLRRAKGAIQTKNSPIFCVMLEVLLLELETQLILAEELEYLSAAEGKRLSALAECVGRALSGLINSLRGVRRDDVA